MTQQTKRAPLGGQAAWTGAELQRGQDWIWHLDDDEISAIDNAVQSARSKDLVWHQLSVSNFPLGDFSARAQAISRELEEGRGIVLLRGLPVERYDADALKIIHYGIACHLGTPIYQSAGGELIGEITDEGAAALDRGTLQKAGDAQPFLSSRARVQTTGPLRFHTDRADVVALLCAEQSVSGGLSQIVSAVAIHDAMLERCPDLLEELFRDLPRSRLGEEKNGGKAYYMLPVFAQQHGHFTTHYSRTYVEAGQKVDEVPRVTDAQWCALDMLQDIGHELCLTHRFEPGDIQYLNNHILYHARTAYEDAPFDASFEPGHGKRLLYRMWLSVPNSRPLPPGHAVLFGDTAPGALRGGIRQADGSNVPANVPE